MNICTFIGRLVSDPVIKDVGSTQLVTFSLAIEEYRKDKDGTKKKRVDFLDFEAWDSGATAFKKVCKKGDLVAIESCARQQKCVTPEEQSKEKINFRVKSFKICNGKD